MIEIVVLQSNYKLLQQEIELLKKKVESFSNMYSIECEKNIRLLTEFDSLKRKTAYYKAGCVGGASAGVLAFIIKLL